MAWPSELYCATTVLGVYHTTNFTDPGAQPTWAAVNTGLAATDVRQFELDPFAPGVKQYLLLEASRDLYIRSGGSWSTILTAAQANTLFSATGFIWWFCTDPSVAGRLWVQYINTTTAGKVCWTAYSDNYGANWTSCSYTVYHEIEWVGGGYGIRAYGDVVWVGYSCQSYFTIALSTNKGTSWAEVFSGDYPYVGLNSLQPTKVYAHANNGFAGGVQTVTSAGVQAYLVTGPPFARSDAFWFSATTVAHGRLTANSRVYVTGDSWATKNAPSAITPSPISISPWSGADEDQMIVGLTPASGSQPHTIGVLYGEADTTCVGIAGTNCETTPFADSIPDTCGGPAVGGIAAVSLLAPYIYVGEVTFV